MSTLAMSLASGQFVVNLPLGKDGVKVSGGGASWTKVDRPRRKPFTSFAGQELLSLAINVYFDQFPDGDVEELIEFVRARMNRPDSRVEPDLLKFAGPAMYKPDLVWVLESVDESGDVWRRGDGRRCRQELTLNVVEYNAAVPVVVAKSPAAEANARADAAPAAEAGTASAPSGRTYTVKAGDTLSAIAARELGNANRWQELADKAGIRDPRTLRIGQVLQLP